MKTETTIEQQIANSIKWIDNLDPKEGYKKTISFLGVRTDGQGGLRSTDDWEDVNDFKAEGHYCCLGVACVTLGIIRAENKNGDPHDKFVFKQGTDLRLTEQLGFLANSGIFSTLDDYAESPVPTVKGEPHFGFEGLISFNDSLYQSDTDFTNMRNVILENLDIIFIPKVAAGLKKHYQL